LKKAGFVPAFFIFARGRLSAIKPCSDIAFGPDRDVDRDRFSPQMWLSGNGILQPVRIYTGNLKLNGWTPIERV